MSDWSLVRLEVMVVASALALLLADLWTPAKWKRQIGYAAAGLVGVILIYSFFLEPEPVAGFGGMYAFDALALFFKRFFLLAGLIILLMSVEFSDRIETGKSEFYVLQLIAMAGMMFAASANDFVLFFVSLELITITFYVLNSFQRRRVRSLEAGVKYLILGALASAFMVYGIALVFGTAGTMRFEGLETATITSQPIYLLGLLLVLVGLGFKVAVFPFQMWAPDVYEGSPAPATAFLAVGSKAAGVVLLLRLLFNAVPSVTVDWNQVLMVMAGVTILYGNLCALPQRNLKRLLAYSSIAHAGYLLLGVTAMNVAGSSAILYYLGGYLFTVLGAFTVICVVMRDVEAEDVSEIAGLHQRSPLLAASMGLSMISLAGIPPLAGFFGKFLLLRAVLERSTTDPGYYWLLAVALIGVIISFYYYLGVVRAMYWSQPSAEPRSLSMGWSTRLVLGTCIAGMLYLGLFPNALMNAVVVAARSLQF